MPDGTKQVEVGIPEEGGGVYFLNADQLDILVAHLEAKPDSRRAVLQMWNVEDDLLKIDSSRDVACNLSVMFSIRQPYINLDPECLTSIDSYTKSTRLLDMTVTNRSNDMIWGLLGANFVHFSILQEYMAARLGARVGVYNHFTNNLHCYDATWKPEEWLTDETPDYYRPKASDPYPKTGRHVISAMDTFVPLIYDPVVFERELPLFVERFGGERFRTEVIGMGLHGREVAVKNEWTEPFLRDVAHPMLSAFRAHKVGEKAYSAVCAASIEADDWRIAAAEWLSRREKK